jgi:hypothetical protein
MNLETMTNSVIAGVLRQIDTVTEGTMTTGLPTKAVSSTTRAALMTETEKLLTTIGVQMNERDTRVDAFNKGVTGPRL